MIRSTALLIVPLVAACAQTPPVRTSYYPARTGLNVRLVRTLQCDKENMPVVASTVTTAVSNNADLSGAPMFLSTNQIDGALADTDIKLEYYSDRRLKSVNATSTGQGETILKSAIQLAAAVALEEAENALQIDKCKEFKKHFGDEPLTLVFTADEKFDSAAGHQTSLIPDAQSVSYFTLFKPLLGDSCVQVGAAQIPAKPVEFIGKSEAGYAMLDARQPALVPVTVSTGPEGTCEVSPLWNGYVPVAQQGIVYKIPIPKAAVFGKQVFAANFDEAGALTLLQYAKEAGEGSAITVAQAAYDAVHETPSEEASRLKTEAEVIGAQQKLVKCKAKPEDCS